MNWESLIAMDWGPCHYKEIKTFGDYVEWLYFTYCLQTGIYILDGWERIIFNIILMLVLGLVLYGSTVYFAGFVSISIAYFSTIICGTENCLL